MLRNPFYCVLALVCHLISLAVLFLLLRAEFVAAAQVIVYAGAVMVLYVFVVAYIGGRDEPLAAGGAPLKILGPLFALALAIELCIAMLGSALKGISSKGAPYVLGFGTPRHIGTLFLTKYLFPFEVASLLLLVAAVGAVVLARRRRGLEPDEHARGTDTEHQRRDDQIPADRHQSPVPSAAWPTGSTSGGGNVSATRVPAASAIVPV